MRRLRIIFSLLTMGFAAAGLMRLLSYKISLPFMFIFLGLSLLENAKECDDKGNTGGAMGFRVTSVIIFAVTIYNLISQIL